MKRLVFVLLVGLISIFAIGQARSLGQVSLWNLNCMGRVFLLI